MLVVDVAVAVGADNEPHVDYDYTYDTKDND